MLSQKTFQLFTINEIKRDKAQRGFVPYIVKAITHEREELGLESRTLHSFYMPLKRLGLLLDQIFPFKPNKEIEEMWNILKHFQVIKKNKTCHLFVFS